MLCFGPARALFVSSVTRMGKTCLCVWVMGVVKIVNRDEGRGAYPESLK